MSALKERLLKKYHLSSNPPDVIRHHLLVKLVALALLTINDLFILYLAALVVAWALVQQQYILRMAAYLLH